MLEQVWYSLRFCTVALLKLLISCVILAYLFSVRWYIGVLMWTVCPDCPFRWSSWNPRKAWNWLWLWCRHPCGLSIGTAALGIRAERQTSREVPLWCWLQKLTCILVALMFVLSIFSPSHLLPLSFLWSMPVSESCADQSVLLSHIVSLLPPLLMHGNACFKFFGCKMQYRLVYI
jgi:hypothetical protein